MRKNDNAQSFICDQIARESQQKHVDFFLSFAREQQGIARGHF